jgi:hypothetical protein
MFLNQVTRTIKHNDTEFKKTIKTPTTNRWQPHANPTSLKVNSVEEKTPANIEPQTPPLRSVKKTLKTYSSRNVLPQCFLNPNPSSTLINLSSYFFN